MPPPLSKLWLSLFLLYIGITLGTNWCSTLKFDLDFGHECFRYLTVKKTFTRTLAKVIFAVSS